jgi:hypothetical protein
MGMPHYYAPVGRCIYCGDDRSKLTDEHIIPLGLGGVEILPDSSCKRCATITGKFEGTVLRAIYGDFRIRFDLPTRRKKERPKTKTFQTVSGADFQVPAREAPVTFFVYKFGQCGFLTGAPRDRDVSNFDLATLHNKDELKQFAEKHGWNNTIRAAFYPNEFRKMIAKIGYAHLTALVGYGEFKPLVLRAIRKKHYNMSYLVGQNPDIEPVVPDGPWFNIRYQMKHRKPDNLTIVVSEIRLFQSNPVPTYHAVVGEIADPAQYERVRQKLLDSGRVDISGPRWEFTP